MPFDMYRTDNPVADAQSHLHDLDQQPAPEKDFECVCCNEKFDKSEGGVKCTDERFCRECFKNNKHIAFYRNHCGLNDRQIWEITEYVTEL